MDSVSQIRHQRLQFLNPRPHLLPVHRRRVRLHLFRTTTPSIATFPSLSVVASSSSSSTSPPLPRRNPASLLLDAAKPVLISLTAAAAVLLARPLQFRASSLAHAAARPPPASTASLEKKPQWGKGGASVAADEEGVRQEQELESRLRTSPDDKDALRALLELRVRQRRIPDAVALADRLAALDPSDNELLLLRAHLRNYAGDTEASREAFEEIIRKDPLVVGAYHGLVMLAAQTEEGGGDGGEGEVEKVMERVEAALGKCKEEGRTEELRDFRLLLAQVRVMGGEYEGALQVYRELVKEEPRDFRPYLCQGVIYTILEKEDEAERQFDQYRKLVPKGHPYAQYFDDNMASLMAFRQMEGSKRS